MKQKYIIVFSLYILSDLAGSEVRTYYTIYYTYSAHNKTCIYLSIIPYVIVMWEEEIDAVEEKIKQT